MSFEGEKAKCLIGKRIMFRHPPSGQPYTTEKFGYIRYCEEYNEIQYDYWCYSCNTGLNEDNLDWRNDTPVCPGCENEIEL